MDEARKKPPGGAAAPSLGRFKSRFDLIGFLLELCSPLLQRRGFNLSVVAQLFGLTPEVPRLSLGEVPLPAETDGIVRPGDAAGLSLLPAVTFVALPCETVGADTHRSPP
jgi:hypothetical protein